MELEISKDGFIAALRTLEGGALIEELDRGLIECVQAIQERGVHGGVFGGGYSGAG